MNTHYEKGPLPDVVNPVRSVKDDGWVASLELCNQCGGECKESAPEESPNGSMVKLVNCKNRFHCDGDYGFYVALTSEEL